MKEKQKTVVKNEKSKGASGTLLVSGLIDEEYLSELSGLQGQEKYERMEMSDSKVRQLMHSVNNPIKSAKWSIEPASNSAEDEKTADLIRQIIFDDINFSDKLDEILTFPWRGHAVFEKVHENKTSEKFGPYTGLADLGFRDQKTLDKWNYVNRKLTSVHQIQSGDLEVDVDIPIETLMIIYNEKKGDNLGFPFHRMIYGNYKRKLLYKTLQAIGIERAGVGVPVLKIPADVKVDSPEYDLAKQQMDEFTQAENAYFMLPSGWDVTLFQNNTFDPAKIQTAIKAENEEISGSLVGMFLEMGVGGNSGNQAGTSTSAKFFKDGLVFLAEKICRAFNRELIPELVRLNYGDRVKEFPKLMQTGITDEVGETLMRIVTGYTNAGVIKNDDVLEEHIREQHNLPKKSLDETEETNAPAPANTPEPTTQQEETELSDKKDTIVKLMVESSDKIQEIIKEELQKSGEKFVIDTMNRYKQLPVAKKQAATKTVVVSRTKKLKDRLETALGDIATEALDQARKMVPKKKNVELRLSSKDSKRLADIFGETVELSSKNKNLPAYVQTLVASQAELITEHKLDEMRARLAFSFSNSSLKSADENIIRQSMSDTLDDFLDSNNVRVAGDDVVALTVNESRMSFFTDDDVLDEIHSFTYMNADPVSLVCNELTGLTIAANDSKSLMYAPPNHHRCKSYLRANLKSSRGVELLEITTWNPSAKAQKGITL